VEQIHRETPEEAITRTTHEARMVLPGAQAIQGFELIAVFNQRRFLGIASTLLAAAMFPLLLGLSLDAYLTAFPVTKPAPASL
jgi:hypothetical protein